MATRSKTKVLVPERKNAPGDPAGYSSIRDEIVGLLQSARQTTVRTVNALMTATYWEIGRRIVVAEQGGKRKADYGDILVKRLGADLSARFGRGFGWRNLFQMRAFYLAWSDILQTLSTKLNTTGADRKLQTMSAISVMPLDLAAIAKRFPLPWSAYVRLNYASEHWRREGENPPVGLILCAQKDAAVAHYALEGLPNKVLAAEYQTVLPDAGLIAKELDDTRRALEARKTQANKATIRKNKA